MMSGLSQGAGRFATLAALVAAGWPVSGAAQDAPLSLEGLAATCLAAGTDAETLRATFAADGWVELGADATAEAFAPFYQGDTLVSIGGGGAPRDGLAATLAQEPARTEEMAGLNAFAARNDANGVVSYARRLYFVHDAADARLTAFVSPGDTSCSLFGTDLGLALPAGAEAVPLTIGDSVMLGAGGLLDLFRANVPLADGRRALVVSAISAEGAAQTFEDAGFTVTEAHSILVAP